MADKPEDTQEQIKVAAQSVDPVLSAQAAGTLPTFPFSGVGTVLGYATGATAPATSAGYTPLLWTEDDLEFDGFENAVIEVKPLSSKIVYKIPGRRNCGNLGGSGSLVTGDATVIASQAQFFARSMVWFCLQLPDGTNASNVNTGSTYTFQGFFNKYNPGSFTGDDKLPYSFDIAINGDVVFTPGS